jgi:hypothetical protein
MSVSMSTGDLESLGGLGIWEECLIVTVSQDKRRHCKSESAIRFSEGHGPENQHASARVEATQQLRDRVQYVVSASRW